MKIKASCSFCKRKATNPEIHLIIANEKAGICTECVLIALTEILKKIPNK